MINDLDNRIADADAEYDDPRRDWHRQYLLLALLGEKHPELPGKPGDEKIPGSDRYIAVESYNYGCEWADRIGEQSARILAQALVSGMAIVLVGAALFHALTFLAVIL